jgi:hypothetical protein
MGKGKVGRGRNGKRAKWECYLGEMGKGEVGKGEMGRHRFDKIFQAFQGPTSFIAYERGWVIFEYSHIFRSGGSLMQFLNSYQKRILTESRASVTAD